MASTVLQETKTKTTLKKTHKTNFSLTLSCWDSHTLLSVGRALRTMAASVTTRRVVAVQTVSTLVALVVALNRFDGVAVNCRNWALALSVTLRWVEVVVLWEHAVKIFKQSKFNMAFNLDSFSELMPNSIWTLSIWRSMWILSQN